MMWWRLCVNFYIHLWQHSRVRKVILLLTVTMRITAAFKVVTHSATLTLLTVVAAAADGKIKHNYYSYF